MYGTEYGQCGIVKKDADPNLYRPTFSRGGICSVHDDVEIVFVLHTPVLGPSSMCR